MGMHADSSDVFSGDSQVVAPKKAALKEAEAEYETVMAGLRGKQAELDSLLSELATLEEQLSNTVSEKDRLEAEVTDSGLDLQY